MAQIKAFILLTQNLCHMNLLFGINLMINGLFPVVSGSRSKYSFSTYP